MLLVKLFLFSLIEPFVKISLELRGSIVDRQLLLNQLKNRKRPISQMLTLIVAPVVAHITQL